eukprot:TRINITY_DN51656_c0_g1_i1.p1 TRINITY_DN51656_c0_g1~~TRINITY_DN51656_c0_g1_i1.p1  ORF type:complete len:690 (-),score=24.01 TRINITY_DN51656_c0_g1_i1:96-2165(-)
MDPLRPVVCVFLLFSSLVGATDTTNAAIKLVDTSEYFYLTYSPNFLPSIPSRTAPLQAELLLASPLDLCKPMTSPPAKKPFVLLALRGNCLYQTKVLNAQAAGAAALVVSDTLEAHYNTSSTTELPFLKNPCDVDCRISEETLSTPISTEQIMAGFPGSNCAKSSDCPSRLCGALTRVQPQQICCMPDEEITISTNTSQPLTAVPALFLGSSRGIKLRALIEKAPSNSITIQLYLRGDPFPWAFVQIWFLGLLTVSLGAYVSARRERVKLSPPAHPISDAPPQTVAPDEELVVTIPTALIFLVVASAFLVGVYFLVKAGARYVVMGFSIMFGLTAAASLVQLVIAPLSWHLNIFPRAMYKRTLCKIKDIEGPSLPLLCCYILSFGVAVLWFFCRHQSWSFVLQDTFSIVIICQFLSFMRLPSVKVGTILLGCFLCYDVFMVFLSPYVFHSSVMLDVATAGRGSEGAASTNPSRCVRVPTEKMPMLLLLPRLDRMGGYAMLGLGDVILPGLLVSLAIRYDYTVMGRDPAGKYIAMISAPLTKRLISSVQHPIATIKRFPYFFAVVVAYGLGLWAAFMAILFHVTINNVQGQPALLYLVPFTVLATIGVSLFRGEFVELWNGPPEFNPKKEAENNGEDSQDIEAGDTSPRSCTSSSTAPQELEDVALLNASPRSTRSSPRSEVGSVVQREK